MKHRAMWTNDVDTTAAMITDTAITAPLIIISGLAPIFFSRTAMKIPGKAKLMHKIGQICILTHAICDRTANVIKESVLFPSKLVVVVICLNCYIMFPYCSKFSCLKFPLGDGNTKRTCYTTNAEWEANDKTCYTCAAFKVPNKLIYKHPHGLQDAKGYETYAHRY